MPAQVSQITYHSLLHALHLGGKQKLTLLQRKDSLLISLKNPKHPKTETLNVTPNAPLRPSACSTPPKPPIPQARNPSVGPKGSLKNVSHPQKDGNHIALGHVTTQAHEAVPWQDWGFGLGSGFRVWGLGFELEFGPLSHAHLLACCSLFLFLFSFCSCDDSACVFFFSWVLSLSRPSCYGNSAGPALTCLLLLLLRASGKRQSPTWRPSSRVLTLF